MGMLGPNPPSALVVVLTLTALRALTALAGRTATAAEKERADIVYVWWLEGEWMVWGGKQQTKIKKKKRKRKPRFELWERETHAHTHTGGHMCAVCRGGEGDLLT